MQKIQYNYWIKLCRVKKKRRNLIRECPFSHHHVLFTWLDPLLQLQQLQTRGLQSFLSTAFKFICFIEKTFQILVDIYDIYIYIFVYLYKYEIMNFYEIWNFWQPIDDVSLPQPQGYEPLLWTTDAHRRKWLSPVGDLNYNNNSSAEGVRSWYEKSYEIIIERLPQSRIGARAHSTLIISFQKLLSVGCFLFFILRLIHRFRFFSHKVQQKKKNNYTRRGTRVLFSFPLTFLFFFSPFKLFERRYMHIYITFFA